MRFKRMFLSITVLLLFSLATNSLGIENPGKGIVDEPIKYDRQSGVASAQAANINARQMVRFEENRGQAGADVRYLSRSGGITTYFTGNSVWYQLSTDQNTKGKSPSAASSSTVKPVTSRVKMTFDGGSSSPEIAGEEMLEGKINYLRGNDPAEWTTGVSTFGAVRYRGIYDGVDLRYYGNKEGQTEYDIEVAPGADPSRISLKFTGAKAVKVDEKTGDLLIRTAAGDLRHKRPVAFQETIAGRRHVAAKFSTRSGGRVSFKLGKHDSTLPLTIDPVVAFSTYLGGTGDVDFVNGIAVDSAGNIYLAGSTNSPDFPLQSPFDGTFGGDQFRYDAFVTKMNPAGTALIYSTYLGGSGDDNGLAIAVDQTGQVYITGFTDSTNFPTSANTFQNAINGATYDGFLTKLNSTGSALVYSTYLGGGQIDGGYALAVDSAGFAYVAGETSSPDFPLADPLQTAYGGGSSDAFVVKFNQSGNGLVFSTFLGGAGDDLALGIGINTSGVYLSGGTRSANFPIANAAQTVYGGGGFFDAFVSKLAPTGTSLLFSTYLGGRDYDTANGLSLDGNGNVYIVGSTGSSNFPVLAPLQGSLNGTNDDAFVTKISSGGTIVYSTYLGGTATESGNGIAVDSTGAAFITGSTFSGNFPVVNAFQPSSGGQSDAFVAKINPTGSALVYSSYLGGSSFDDGIDIALDAGNNAIVGGGTDSANFPLVTPFQNNRRGASDAFVLRIISSTTVSGQVFTSNGLGLRNAVVTLTDPTGARRQVLTNQFGFYNFSDVLTGVTYTVNVTSKRYRFLPANITPMNTTHSINFTGQE